MDGDSDDDDHFEKRSTTDTPAPEPPPAPIRGRPKIEGVPRDPVTNRIKKPRPPRTEKQIQALKAAREKRAIFVAERKRLMEEAKEASKKIGVTKTVLDSAKAEAEMAKAEAEKLKAELEQERKKKVAAPAKKKAKYSSSSESDSDSSSSDDDSVEEKPVQAPYIFFY